MKNLLARNLEKSSLKANPFEFFPRGYDLNDAFELEDFI